MYHKYTQTPARIKPVQLTRTDLASGDAESRNACAANMKLILFENRLSS